MNFHLDQEKIVIRTAGGSRLATAAADAIVAFETDEYDPATRTGWSVTAVGRARTVDDPEELTRLSRLPLNPWATGGREHFIVVVREQLSGRRIHR